MKSILDPTFKYRSSVDTDLRETFQRVRREMAKQPKPTPLDDPLLSRVAREHQKASA